MNQQHIRNFCIIAHIDHGKSTLADRFLELTGTVEKRKMQEQLLDTMELERERGITIKLQPVTMSYKLLELIENKERSTNYKLNLIDTPGHADFSYEVSRSLAAVEGAVLLVDATQGVQAQTIYNLEEAKKQSLKIIPAINKIDLPHSRVKETKEEISLLLECEEEEILEVSAKTGEGVEDLLKEIIKKVPSPNLLTSDVNKCASRALIFDSQYDQYKGVIAFVRVFDGEIKPGDKIQFMAQNVSSEVEEVGYLRPFMEKSGVVSAGEIGYIATGMKDVEKVRVGDTIASLGIRNPAPELAGRQESGIMNQEGADCKVEPLQGYKEPQPVVFAGFYLQESDNFENLRTAFSKLRLSDASLKYDFEQSEILGRGFRCGFLGMLHLDIVRERLKREYGIEPLITSPSVFYKVVLKSGEEKVIYTPGGLPDLSFVEKIEEPWVDLEVIVPANFLGPVMQVLEKTRAVYKDTQYISPEKVLLKTEIPLADIIIDFYDKLKNVSQGYASMGYEILEHRPGDLVRLDVMIAGENESAFSKIVPRKNAQSEGRAIVEKLKGIMPKQMFAVSLQVAVGGTIVAREDISAMRKDVTGHLYGGDYSRKRKLLEKQKKGKKKMRERGKVHIPSEVYMKMLKK